MNADAAIATPSQGGDRLHLIDALRGFALAGVLLANLAAFSQYQFLDDAAKAALPSAGFDTIAQAFVHVFVDSKAITLFSMLFGLGFSLQMERAATRGGGGLAIFLRRIAILAILGALHGYLLWWGDILLIYGVLAFGLPLFRHASDRTLLVSGLLVILVLPSLLSPWIEPWVETLPSEEAMNAATVTAFASPSFSVALKQNAVYGNFAYLLFWGVFPFVFGRFLLGYWAGRKRLLQDPGANRRLLRALCAAGLTLGLVLTCVFEFLDIPAAVRTIPGMPGVVAKFFAQTASRSSSLLLAIGYGAGFALLYLRPRWRHLQNLLAPVGRMALSNYLTHTVVCVGVFYGFGLGVGPKYGLMAWFVTWVVLFGAQIPLSHWWLSRFRFGPMEWLWRSLTYGRAQPMRLAAMA